MTMCYKLKNVIKKIKEKQKKQINKAANTMALCSNVPAIHIFALILGSLEIVLFGGVIFGWHSVVYIYKDSGYFSHLCPDLQKRTPGYINITNGSVTNISSNYMYGTLTVSSADSPTDFSYSSTSGPNVKYYNTHPEHETDHLNLSESGGIALNSKAASNTSASHTNSYSEQDEVSGKSDDELTCEERMHLHLKKNGSMQVCKAQDEQFNLIFSLATGVNGVLSFPSGVLYDHLGTRISRIFSIVSFVAGQLCLIFASASQPYLLYPGFVCLVYGGYQILMTNLQLAGLVPSLRSTIMSLYSGSYDTSSSIFLLFKAAYEGGVSVNACFAAHCAVYVIIFSSSTFFLLPATRVPSPHVSAYRLRCSPACKCKQSKELKHCKPGSSNEWKVDANGSVILTSAMPTGTLHGGQASKAQDAHCSSLNDTENKTAINDSKNLPDLSNGEPDNSASLDEGKEKASLAICDMSGAHQRNAVVGIENGHIDGKQNLDLDMRRSQRETEHDNFDMTEMDEKGVKAEENETMLMNERKKSFKEVVLSKLFLTDLLWISVHRLRSWIFVGMFNPWITRLVCGDKALVSHYTSVYAGLQFFGILTAPLSGQLMDRKIKGGEKYGNPRYERLHASIASFLLNSSVAVLLTICALIPVHQLQYLTFALHCLHRSFLYGPNSAFVANAFPNEHFGKLFGVTLTVSAMFSMLQYPMFIIMQKYLQGDPMAINIFLLVLMLASFTHPFCIWQYLQKKLAKSVPMQ